MNIIETNNNIITEIEYELKIINGESAEVYINGGLGYNSDLMRDGYWEEFIRTTDSITLPIESISSMVKTQSVWFRNTNNVDYITLDLVSDYDNNIIEFINKGVFNKNLDFDSIEQLIFIVEARYINSAGRISKKPIFVGRPTIEKYTDQQLRFKIYELDYILKDSNFEDNVLQKPTGSFYNFIGLKEALERIYNNPHNDNDDYVYPVTPFVINEENYISDKFGDDYLKETELIPSSYEQYAEASVYGDENRIQLFYYRDSPECGFVDIYTDNNGNYISSESFNLSSLRFYANPDELDNVSSDSELYKHKKIVDNIFRCFRPIKSFISENQILTKKIAIINGQDCEFQTASSQEWRIDIGDEIILMEQKIDLIKLDDKSNWKSLVFSTMTSNVLYYNRTKNIMYWDNVIKQPISPTLPPLFLDCRLDGYFGLKIEWDNHYNWGDRDNVQSRHYNPSNDIILSYDSIGSKNNIRAKQYLNSCFRDFSISQNGVIGYYELTSDKIVIEPNDEVPVDTYNKMFQISRMKPKTVRIGDNGRLVYLYQNTENFGNPTDIEGGRERWSLAESSLWINNSFAWQGVIRNHTEYPYLWEEGVVYEISKNWEANYGIATVTNESDYIKFTNVIFPKTSDYHSTFAKSIYSTEVTYLSANFSSLNGYIYFIEHFNKGISPSEGHLGYDYQIRYYNGNEQTLYKNYLVKRLLDINLSTDKVILLDDNYLVRQNISDDIELFKSTGVVFFEYLLSRKRDNLSFSFSSSYYNQQEDFKVPIRLLSFSESRYKASIGIANSFFKNSYSDNLGIKRIGFSQPNSIILTDDEITKESLDIKTIKYNKLEYEKYNPVKNGFTSEDNEVAESKEQDDNDYDESFSINMYSDIDVDMSIKLERTSEGIIYTVSNKFGEDTATIVPSNYSSFDFTMNGDFSGIKIYVNFYDAELEVGKVFFGKIERRTLEENGDKDYVESLNNKYTWKDSNVLGLKFPFLFRKFSQAFNYVMENYWIDDNQNVRKILEVELKLNSLILFNENYSVFNIGERRIVIDSDSRYLNGYGFYKGSLVPFNNNKASFYIENITYDFKNATTTMKLISI